MPLGNPYLAPGLLDQDAVGLLWRLGGAHGEGGQNQRDGGPAQGMAMRGAMESDSFWTSGPVCLRPDSSIT